jgi:hypothetical protein
MCFSSKIFAFKLRPSQSALPNQNLADYVTINERETRLELPPSPGYFGAAAGKRDLASKMFSFLERETRLELATLSLGS